MSKNPGDGIIEGGEQAIGGTGEGIDDSILIGTQTIIAGWEGWGGLTYEGYGG